MSNQSSSRSLWTVLAILVGVVAIGGVGYLIGRGNASSAPAATVAAAPTGAAPASAESSAAAPMPAPETGAPGASAAPAGAQSAPAPGRRYRQAAAPAPPPSGATSEAAEPQPAAAPPEPAPPEPIVVRIPAGTKIDLRLTSGVSSQTASVGDAVAAELAQPLVADGRTVAPSGTRVRGSVTEVHALKKIGGQARLALSFDRIESREGPIAIQAAYAHEGKSETGKDAATIAAGAVVGTVLGNQAHDNRRGKVVGGLLGAGVGAAIAASTPGEKIELAPGATLHLTLRSDTEARILP
jgi:Glycine zipper 2TM domain